jgi:hypothetical protein
MIDSASRNNYYEEENKPKVRLSQLKTEPKVLKIIMKKEPSAFFQRLARVLGTENVPEIAKLFKISDNAVYKWRKGLSLPNKGKLKVIAERTKSSDAELAWILYGDEYKPEIEINSARDNKELSDSDKLIQENSFPGVVKQLLDRIKDLESRMLELEIKFNNQTESLRNNAKSIASGGKQPFALKKSLLPYPEKDYQQISNELTEQTGKTIPFDAIILYDRYITDGDEEFLERNYPTEIQEVLANYFKDELEPLSEQAPDEINGKTAG